MDNPTGLAQLPLKTLLFGIISLVVIGSAAAVTFSRSLVTSAFALLGTLAGAAALYVLLSADFLAATQVIVYIGGILVLFLFAVMLTNRIDDVNVSNASMSLFAAAPIGLIVGWMGLHVALSNAFTILPVRDTNPTAIKIGDALLDTHLLPFEFVSVVLLAAMIGAVVIARREVRPSAGARVAAQPETAAKKPEVQS